MTAAAGRFVLQVPTPRGALAVLSRPTDAGVPIIGVWVFGGFGVSKRPETTLISEISKSSSSAKAAIFGDC